MSFCSLRSPSHWGRYSFIEHERPQSSNPLVENTKRSRTPANPLDRMELAVRVVSKHERAPRKGDCCPSFNTEDKMHGESSGDDIVECDV
jgi:hypothetical protein